MFGSEQYLFEPEYPAGQEAERVEELEAYYAVQTHLINNIDWCSCVNCETMTREEVNIFI